MTEPGQKARLWLRVSNQDQQIENQRIGLKSLCDQRGYNGGQGIRGGGR